jgi:hypothetical protein
LTRSRHKLAFAHTPIRSRKAEPKEIGGGNGGSDDNDGASGGGILSRFAAARDSVETRAKEAMSRHVGVAIRTRA